MSLTLYDTATRAKRPFTPQDPKRVTLYLCGPTVYNYAHIGNARGPVVFDVLFRVLQRTYGAEHVVYARNVTDVDDKIIAAAAETGEPIAAITDKFTEIYRGDMAALGALAPTLEPHATDHIAHMIALMETLIAGGHAYAAQGHVLFHVASYERYGALSNRSREDMVAGARVEVAPYKKDPGDFVLWKPAKAGEPAWESPWGAGRPGWHVECSAMIAEVLGATIDIHGGGQDLVFPHHENEIAQSVCAHGAPLANYWMHNGFLTMDSEKMSKSLGNVKLVHGLLEHWPGEVLRFALLSAHYRQPLDWTDDLLQRSKATLNGWYDALWKSEDLPAAKPDAADVRDRLQDVIAALEDDLNTPQVFAAMAGLRATLNSREADAGARAAAKAALMEAGAMVGVLAHDPEAWFQGDLGEGVEDALDGAAIEELLAQRHAARAAKDFHEADRIRDALTAAGVVIEDGPRGSTWRRA